MSRSLLLVASILSFSSVGCIIVARDPDGPRQPQPAQARPAPSPRPAPAPSPRPAPPPPLTVPQLAAPSPAVPAPAPSPRPAPPPPLTVPQLAAPSPTVPAPAPTPAPNIVSAYVVVNVVGGACTVAIDGRNYGVQQTLKERISLGDHEITCVFGRERQAARISVRDLSSYPVEFRVTPPVLPKTIDVKLKR